MIVVTGAAGQLGSALRRQLGPEATYLVRDDLDLEDAAAIARTIGALRPTTLINCAAYTAVDAAETNSDLAYLINATAVGHMARATADVGARFVTVSTDYVFDGTADEPYVESSETNPVNVYGSSKLAGEHAALESNLESLIVRTSWVISWTHPNFVDTIIRLARDRELPVVDDQFGHPTLATDLARGIIEAVRSHVTGVLHLTNQGVTTWFDLAREVVELAGIDPRRITPCTTNQYPTPAGRPRNSVLESERLDGLDLAPLPHYRDGIGDVVRRLGERPTGNEGGSKDSILEDP